MTGKELIKLMEKNGWHLDRVNGSHHVMIKGNQTEIIPVHKTDMKKGLLNAIMKRAGLK